MQGYTQMWISGVVSRQKNMQLDVQVLENQGEIMSFWIKEAN